jgi:hypothetical protein
LRIDIRGRDAFAYIDSLTSRAGAGKLAKENKVKTSDSWNISKRVVGVVVAILGLVLMAFAQLSASVNLGIIAGMVFVGGLFVAIAQGWGGRPKTSV